VCRRVDKQAPFDLPVFIRLMTRPALFVNMVLAVATMDPKRLGNGRNPRVPKMLPLSPLIAAIADHF
jgi:hypothetical protein